MKVKKSQKEIDDEIERYILNTPLDEEEIKKTKLMAAESLARPNSWYTLKIHRDRDKVEAKFALKHANYWEKKLNEDKQTRNS